MAHTHSYNATQNIGVCVCLWGLASGNSHGKWQMCARIQFRPHKSLLEFINLWLVLLLLLVRVCKYDERDEVVVQQWW